MVANSFDDKILFWDDAYDNMLEWYLRNPWTGVYTQLRMAAGGDGNIAHLVGLSFKDILAKADLASTTTGAFNSVFNLGVFINYIAQANAIAALPQGPWRRKGYRAISTASKTSGLGIAEGGTINLSTDPVVEAYVQVNPAPKELRIVKRFTHRLAFLSQIADAVTINDTMREMEVAWRRSMDKDILEDIDVAASNDMESLKRIAGSDVEFGIGAAGNADLYGLVRASQTWSRGTVVQAAGALSVAHLDDLYDTQAPFYTEFPAGKVFVTGYDTLMSWSRLEAAKQRLTIEPVEFTAGDGIKLSGQKGGFVLGAYRGQPIVPDDQVSTTTGTIADILSLDFSSEAGVPRIGVAWGRPPEYFENADPVVAGHAVVGGFYAIGEVYAVHFPSQGKILDID